MEEVLYSQGQGDGVCQQHDDSGSVPSTSTMNEPPEGEVTPGGEAETAPTLTCKNPTMYLNELRKGLKFDLIGQTQDGLNKNYTVSVVVDGEPFQATARSIKLAKQEASKFALLKKLKILYIPEDQMTPEMIKSSAEKKGKRKASVSDSPGQKKRKLVARNALMTLNEFKPGIDFVVLSSTGPVHAPNFVMGVDIDGVRYEGFGKSKKVAKLAAAENALKAFPEIYNQYLEEKLELENTSINNADSTTSFTVGSNELRNKHPCMALNELRPGIEYNVISEEGLPHERTYVVAITVDGETFQGSGRSKKLAKQSAATAALGKFFKQ